MYDAFDRPTRNHRINTLISFEHFEGNYTDNHFSIKPFLLMNCKEKKQNKTKRKREKMSIESFSI